jgi:hypothetical protein
MAERRPYGGPIPLRQRSTAVVVLSRADPRPGGVERRPSDGGRAGAGGRSSRLSRWLAGLTWLVLGAAIASLWALLLLGDSLRVSG